MKLSKWKEEGLSKQYVMDAAKASNELRLNIGLLDLVMHYSKAPINWRRLFRGYPLFSF